MLYYFHGYVNIFFSLKNSSSCLLQKWKPNELRSSKGSKENAGTTCSICPVKQHFNNDALNFSSSLNMKESKMYRSLNNSEKASFHPRYSLRCIYSTIKKDKLRKKVLFRDFHPVLGLWMIIWNQEGSTLVLTGLQFSASEQKQNMKIHLSTLYRARLSAFPLKGRPWVSSLLLEFRSKRQFLASVCPFSINQRVMKIITSLANYFMKWRCLPCPFAFQCYSLLSSLLITVLSLILC